MFNCYHVSPSAYALIILIYKIIFECWLNIPLKESISIIDLVFTLDELKNVTAMSVDCLLNWQLLISPVKKQKKRKSFLQKVSNRTTICAIQTLQKKLKLYSLEFSFKLRLKRGTKNKCAKFSDYFRNAKPELAYLSGALESPAITPHSRVLPIRLFFAHCLMTQVPGLCRPSPLYFLKSLNFFFLARVFHMTPESRLRPDVFKYPNHGLLPLLINFDDLINDDLITQVPSNPAPNSLDNDTY
jgi:hypothetical protein